MEREYGAYLPVITDSNINWTVIADSLGVSTGDTALLPKIPEQDLADAGITLIGINDEEKTAVS